MLAGLFVPTKKEQAFFFESPSEQKSLPEILYLLIEKKTAHIQRCQLTCLLLHPHLLNFTETTSGGIQRQTENFAQMDIVTRRGCASFCRDINMCVDLFYEV